MTGVKIALVFALVALPSVALADPEPVFPLVAVTADNGTPVVDRAFIDSEVAIAEKVFGALGVHVAVGQVRSLGSELARIEDPRMRDRFAPLVTAHEISIFVVKSLRDNEQVGLYRRGVTWDSHTTPSRRFIILSADASASSLAHELGLLRHPAALHGEEQPDELRPRRHPRLP
jgi:hypothetical protein